MKKIRTLIFSLSLLLALFGFGQTETTSSKVELKSLISKELNHEEVIVEVCTLGSRYLNVLVYDYPEQKLSKDNKNLALRVKSTLLHTYPFLSDYKELKVAFTSLKSVDSDYWNKQDMDRKEFFFSL